MLKILAGNELAIIVGEEYYDVTSDDVNSVSKLRKGYAYVIGEFVYPYRGKLKDNKKKRMEPGIYKSGEQIKIIHPETDKDRNLYSVNNVVDLSENTIFRDISNDRDRFLQSEDIEIINNNTDIYIPTIKEEDDFLKYLIKKVIIDKRINLRNYKERFSNEYALNNMKSGLNKSTKMTVTNFKLWCEILGIDWEMTVRDNGSDDMNPLSEEIHISSEDF